MNFPDDVIVLRPTATDAYGNKGTDFTNATEIPTRGFHVVKDALLLLPKSADVKDGDRYRLGDDVYAGALSPVRSPSALKLYTVRLSRLED